MKGNLVNQVLFLSAQPHSSGFFHHSYQENNNLKQVFESEREGRMGFAVISQSCQFSPTFLFS